MLCVCVVFFLYLYVYHRELPVLTHPFPTRRSSELMLLWLIAPRPMLRVNGDEDAWSDWKGERVAAEAARPAYALFGRQNDLQIFTHKGGDRKSTRLNSSH